MKICPIDWQEPLFLNAQNSSAAARREAVKGREYALSVVEFSSLQRFTFAPRCVHSEAFAATFVARVLNVGERLEIESKWGAETERLFVAYTATWTDAQRDAHRARLWPKAPTTWPEWQARVAAQKPVAVRVPAANPVEDGFLDARDRAPVRIGTLTAWRFADEAEARA